MAFIFEVETGTGDPDANSYASVDYADDYIGTNSQADAAWAALTDDEKEAFLVRASRYLDQTVAWNGTKVEGDSGLRWPRAGVYDVDGFEIADDTIPDILMQAVCELASYLANGDDWTSPQGTRGFKQIEVDVINLRMEDNYVRPSMPDYVSDMLSALGSVNRGTRPAFKKIIRT